MILRHKNDYYLKKSLYLCPVRTKKENKYGTS